MEYKPKKMCIEDPYIRNALWFLAFKEKQKYKTKNKCSRKTFIKNL